MLDALHQDNLQDLPRPLGVEQAVVSPAAILIIGKGDRLGFRLLKHSDIVFRAYFGRIGRPEPPSIHRRRKTSVWRQLAPVLTL